LGNLQKVAKQFDTDPTAELFWLEKLQI
jgi:hypothetical protein